jgi:hypothetical protein
MYAQARGSEHIVVALTFLTRIVILHTLGRFVKSGFLSRLSFEAWLRKLRVCRAAGIIMWVEAAPLPAVWERSWRQGRGTCVDA